MAKQKPPARLRLLPALGSAGDIVTKASLAKRRARADLAAFDRIMNRKNGASPLPEDELPADMAHLGPAD